MRATPIPFQCGGAAYACGGPMTVAAAFDPAAAAADNPTNGLSAPVNLLQPGPYVPVLRRQIRASLQAGSLTGSGALYRARADARDSPYEPAASTKFAANAGDAGGVFLNAGEDAPRVEVLSLADTPFGQWLTQTQSEAVEGVSSFYTDLAGDFIGARRVANPRAIVFVPDVRLAEDDTEPKAYTLPEAVWLDAPLTRTTPGASTILASPSHASPMFQRHYTGAARKRQDAAEGAELPAGDGVEALPMGIMQNVLKWGQANPILAGLIAGFFAVMMGAVVARNPGQAANPT